MLLFITSSDSFYMSLYRGGIYSDTCQKEFFAGTKVVTFCGNILIDFSKIYNKDIAPLLSELANKIEIMTASWNIELASEMDGFFQEFSSSIGQFASDLSLNMMKWVSGKATGIPGLIAQSIITVLR